MQQSDHVMLTEPELVRHLLDRTDELAEAVMKLHYGRNPALRGSYDRKSAAKALDDCRWNVAFLAEAIANETPQIFQQYMEWLRSVVEPYGVTPPQMLEHLDCLQECIESMLPGARQPLVRAILEGGRNVFLKPSEPPPSRLQAQAGPHEGLAQRYLEALLEADRHRAVRLVLDAAQRAVPIRDLYLQVLQPVQHEIGRLWQTRAVSVAQEHFATAVTQLVMSLLYPRIVRSPRNGRTLLATCVGNDLHEIGVRMVADLFELRGWDTIYLGANTPARSVRQSLEQHRPDILAISVTLAIHLPDLRELISQVRASPRGDVKILLGGYPFNALPDLWRRFDADGYAPSGDTAVQAAERLLEGEAAG